MSNTLARTSYHTPWPDDIKKSKYLGASAVNFPRKAVRDSFTAECMGNRKTPLYFQITTPDYHDHVCVCVCVCTWVCVCVCVWECVYVMCVCYVCLCRFVCVGLCVYLCVSVHLCGYMRLGDWEGGTWNEHLRLFICLKVFLSFPINLNAVLMPCIHIMRTGANKYSLLSLL